MGTEVSSERPSRVAAGRALTCANHTARLPYPRGGRSNAPPG